MTDAVLPASGTTTGLVVDLIRAADAASSMLASIGDQFDLAVDDWLILGVLRDGEGRSMSEVSSQTVASGSSLTRAVDRLVSRSLVYRTPGVADRRRVEVRISDAGRDLHDQMAAQVARLEELVAERLGADRGTTARALRRFVTV
ncbi:MarR family winged helix-turn-helix transcriptional regulator [Gordonia shandongensis]|uniref:MarR family winged helix-turn-helix transcriptional regulator n=1 Tax=Gordonia shandongensis TaxID=376351 RepID=UPI00040CA596|nr:MarR family transcriptional regulator [Gordonia shandongensis]